MLIQLKQITQQLTEALGCPKGIRVAAEVESGADGEEIYSWLFVDIHKNGTMTPHKRRYKTIKDLFTRNPYKK